MKKLLFLLILLFIPFITIYSQDYGDNITQLDDIVSMDSLDYVNYPVFGPDFTMDDVMGLKKTLGMTHKSYDILIKDMIYETTHKLHVLKYKTSVIVIFQRYPDNRLILNSKKICDLDVPLRGKLRMGMSKKEFCKYIGVPYEKYIDLNEIYISLYQSQCIPEYYIFNDSEQLIAVISDAWFDDTEYVNME